MPGSFQEKRKVPIADLKYRHLEGIHLDAMDEALVFLPLLRAHQKLARWNQCALRLPTRP